MHISCANKNSTGALLEAFDPKSYYMEMLSIKYLVATTLFPFFSVDFANISLTTSSSGVASVNTAIPSATWMESTSTFELAFTGINILQDSLNSFQISSSASWGGSSTINIQLSISGAASYTSHIAFYILHWNSTRFSFGNGIAGSIILTSQMLSTFAQNYYYDTVLKVNVYISNYTYFSVPLNSSQLLFEAAQTIMNNRVYNTYFSYYYSNGWIDYYTERLMFFSSIRL
jgi:hypothetical protein